MPLETATYVNGLVSANPGATDGLNQSDDHMRLIKAVLLNTFPNLNAAVTATPAALNTAAAGFPVATASIVDAAVTTAKLADAAVTTVKLLDANVTSAKIADLAVGTAQLADTNVTTGKLANSAVTYAKLQNVTSGVLLGRSTAGAGTAEELAIGANLSLSSGVLSGTAGSLGFPSNLVIKVATNTTVTVSADAVEVTDGTSTKLLTGLSATLDLATNGAVNTLDAGTIAIDTWYYVWAIAKADGTKGTLASTSATAPTLPTGYTFKRRIGAVRTIHASASLYGTWQLGAKVQYVVGLASTTTSLPFLAQGVFGSPTTPTWNVQPVGALVPPTATVIYGTAYVANGTVMVAPNANYGARNSITAPAPLVIGNQGTISINTPFELVLESTNLYYMGDTSAAGAVIRGWEDNI